MKSLPPEGSQLKPQSVSAESFSRQLPVVHYILLGIAVIAHCLYCKQQAHVFLFARKFAPMRSTYYECLRRLGYAPVLMLKTILCPPSRSHLNGAAFMFKTYHESPL
eukprot:2115817-Amphidinium_carterae.2